MHYNFVEMFNRRGHPKAIIAESAGDVSPVYSRLNISLTSFPAHS